MRKPVLGFEDTYEVDASGNVYRLPSGRLRRPGVSKNGYAVLMLSREGRRTTLYIHRIVAYAFLGAASGRDVNHINGDRLDNRLANLEWATRSENNQHAYDVLGRVGPNLGKTGDLSPYSTKIVGVDANGLVVVAFSALKDAQRAGYKAPAISRCLKKPGTTHHGLHWARANQPTPASCAS